MAIDLQSHAANRNLAGSTNPSNVVRGTLILLDKNEQRLKQWLVRQAKCTIGSASDCSVCCELPGIAPHHALLVIGAKQVFLRALAPKVSLNGVYINELVLADEHQIFEIAGHRFSFSRKQLQAAQVNPSLELSKPKRIRFSNARVECQPGAPLAPPPVNAESFSGISRQWISQAIKEAVAPIESRLRELAIPTDVFKLEIDRIRQLESTRLAATADTDQLVNSQKAIERVITQQTDSIDSIARRVTEINDRIVAIEYAVNDSLAQESSIAQDTRFQAFQDSLNQIQERVESVFNLARELQGNQTAISDSDVDWKSAVTTKLTELPELIERLQSGMNALSSAMEALHASHQIVAERDTPWQASVQDTLASVRQSADVLVQWHSNVLLRDDFYAHCRQLAIEPEAALPAISESIPPLPESLRNFSNQQVSQPHNRITESTLAPLPAITESIRSDSTVPYRSESAQHQAAMTDSEDNETAPDIDSIPGNVAEAQQVTCVLDRDPPSEQIPIWWKSEDLTQIDRSYSRSQSATIVEPSRQGNYANDRHWGESAFRITPQEDSSQPEDVLHAQSIGQSPAWNESSTDEITTNSNDLASSHNQSFREQFTPEIDPSAAHGHEFDAYGSSASGLATGEVDSFSASSESTNFDESAFAEDTHDYPIQEFAPTPAGHAEPTELAGEYLREQPTLSHEDEVTNSINDIMARLSGSYYKEPQSNTPAYGLSQTPQEPAAESYSSAIAQDTQAYEPEIAEAIHENHLAGLGATEQTDANDQGDDESSSVSLSSAKSLEVGGSGEDGEESVEDYMQRLLARMRGEEPSKLTSTKSPQSRPTAPVSSGAMKQPTEVSSPRTQSRTSKSSDLAAMRELANNSARSAIQVSARRRYGTAIILKLSISLVGFIAGSTLLLINGLQINVSFIATIACFLVGGIWGFDAASSLRPMLSAAAPPMKETGAPTKAPTEPKSESD